MITSVTTIIGVLIMMLSISPLMTLIAILILPVSVLFISTIMKHSQGYFRDQQNFLGQVNGQVEEVYSGHNIVKAFNKEEETIATFEETNQKLYHSAWKSQFLSGTDDADHAVRGKSWVCRCGDSRRLSGNPGND